MMQFTGYKLFASKCSKGVLFVGYLTPLHVQRTTTEFTVHLPNRDPN